MIRLFQAPEGNNSVSEKIKEFHSVYNYSLFTFNYSLFPKKPGADGDAVMI